MRSFTARSISGPRRPLRHLLELIAKVVFGVLLSTIVICAPLPAVPEDSAPAVAPSSTPAARPVVTPVATPAAAPAAGLTATPIAAPVAAPAAGSTATPVAAAPAAPAGPAAIPVASPPAAHIVEPTAAPLSAPTLTQDATVTRSVTDADLEYYALELNLDWTIVEEARNSSAQAAKDIDEAKELQKDDILTKLALRSDKRTAEILKLKTIRDNLAKQSLGVRDFVELAKEKLADMLRYPLILRDPESAGEARVLAEEFCVSLDERT
jgi:hypothetical protein